MPIHLPFHLPRIPEFLKRPLDPSQTLEAFEHYAEKAIDFATRHGGEIGRNIMDDLVDAAAPYAAFLDTTVDAFLPGINLYYGEKWASRQGRKNPFKQKGGVVRPKSSQSPAQRQRMSKRARDQYDDFVKAEDREIRRRLHRAMGQPTKSFSVSKTLKKFKKSRKPIDDKGKYVSRNYDDYGTMERDHSWWLGFQTHGGRGRLFDVIAEAVTKAVLAKIRIYPRSYSEDIDSPEFSQATLYFTRVLNTGVDEPVSGAAITLNGQTFQQVCASFRTQIYDQANGSPTTGPSTDTVARYLYKVRLANADASKAFIECRDVGDSIVDVKVQQKIRFQNVTKNIDGSNDTDQAGLNPLRGRKYEFANFRPRLIDSVQQLPNRTNEASVSYNYDSFMISDPVLGGVEGICPMPAVGSMAKDDPISHPPIAKQLFSNCKGSAPISLAAGAMKVEYTTFRMVHKMKTFIERIYWASFDKGAFGGCVWFGLEKAFRQAKPSGATNDDRIAIGFNRECHMYAKVKFVAQKSMLKHFKPTDIGLVAAD